MKTFSPPITIRIVPDTEVGRAAANLQPYSFSAPLSVPSLGQMVPRLDPFNTYGSDWPDCSGGTPVVGVQNSQAWIWGSKLLWHSGMRSVIGMNSPHNTLPAMGTLDNGYLVLLSRYDVELNLWTIYESPIWDGGTQWPRSIGHIFDNQCIVDDVLYKMTTPAWRDGSYVQPQIVKIDLSQLTHDVTSGREGAAYIGTLPMPWDWNEDTSQWVNPGKNITAGALDYLPGNDSLVFLHKKWLSFMPLSTGVWTQPIDLGFTPMYDTGLAKWVWPFHNVGHYNPNSNKFVCGGGAYNPDGPTNHRYGLQWVSVHGVSRTVVALDNSPVIMSVSEYDMPAAIEPPHLVKAKSASTYDPSSTESIFFHKDGNIYGLDPEREIGNQWRTIGAIPVDVIAKPIKWACTIPEYRCILIGQFGADGTSTLRLYRGA